MKKISWAVLCSMGIALPAFSAPPQAGDLILNPAVNYTFYDKDLRLDDTFGWQFGLEYVFTEHWAAEVQYAQVKPDRESRFFRRGGEVKDTRVDINALYYIGNYGNWVPYLAAGVGRTQLDTGFSDDTHTEWNVGGGTRYYFSDRWSARGDVRLVNATGDRHFNDVVVSLGLSYAFPLGGSHSSSAATPAPAPAPQPVAQTPAPVAATPEPAPAAVAPVPEPAAPAAPIAGQSINLRLTFANGSDRIEPQFKPRIAEVAEFLKKYPNATAEIEGHTDNRGSAALNRDLSKRRAEAVKTALVQEFGIDAGRLSAAGYGPDKPIASNDTAAGRAENRRVVATFKN